MRFYTYGDPAKPAFMTIPGTACYWSAGFDAYIEDLTRHFHVVCVSFDGFDETESDAVYPGMEAEAEKIEAYVRDELGGRVFCIYGCSLGGSYASYLLQRRNIQIDHIILGSSDMDQDEGFSARAQSRIAARIITPILQKGELPGWMLRANESKIKKDPSQRAYREAFIKMFTARALPFVKRESMYNEFYSDLVTRIDDGIDVAGSTVHIFYAKKMGEKYLDRYRQHFANPDIREHDLSHEELFVCRHDEWLAEVLDCCGIQQASLTR